MELFRPIFLDPRSPDLGDLIGSLPESRGVYVLSLPSGPPHMGSTLNLKRRITRLLLPSYNASKHALSAYAEKADSVSCWAASSRLEASLLLYQITRQYFPNDYLKRLRLRLPWFVALHTADAFPRLELVNRPARRHSAVYGPFLSRDVAQRYEQEVLGLFQVRRCVETLEPSAEHPGCIYGEMNQCLRPCQCAVSRDEYANEVVRLGEFLATNGKTTAAVLQTARERASLDMDFEQAAQLHKRWEKVNAAAASRDAVIAPVEEFNGVALTRGLGPQEFRLWPMWRGYWQNAIHLEFSAMEPGARSLDSQLRERVAQGLANPTAPAAARLEHLALFARWFYSSWREGSWYGCTKLEDLPYRRMVREISNLSRAC